MVAASYASVHCWWVHHYGEFSIVSVLISGLKWEQLKLNMACKILNGKVIVSPDNLPRVSTRLAPPEDVMKYQLVPTDSSFNLKPNYSFNVSFIFTTQ